MKRPTADIINSQAAAGPSEVAPNTDWQSVAAFVDDTNPAAPAPSHEDDSSQTTGTPSEGAANSAATTDLSVPGAALPALSSFLSDSIADSFGTFVQEPVGSGEVMPQIPAVALASNESYTTLSTPLSDGIASGDLFAPAAFHWMSSAEANQTTAALGLMDAAINTKLGVLHTNFSPGGSGSPALDINFAGNDPHAALPAATISSSTPHDVFVSAPTSAVADMVAVSAPTGSTGNLTINLEFDAAAMAAPASFRAGIEAAAAMLDAAITTPTPITVNLNIQYGEGGIDPTSADAGPDNGLFEPYSTVRADLLANAVTGDTIFNSLPNTSTIQGQSQVAVWNAQLKAMGLLSPTAPTDDGTADFGSGISSSLLVGIALHELSHALGRVPYGPEPDIFDLFRFTSAGTRFFDDNVPTSAAYFSLDDGNSKLADYGQNSDPSDFLNPPNSNLTPNDAFNEFYDSNTLQTLTSTDLLQMDALGFNTVSPVIVQTDTNTIGTTTLAEVANEYFLRNSSGIGPVLTYSGAPVVAGEFGGWAPIGAALTATGYEVAWKNGNNFIIWDTDSSGHFTSYATGELSGSSVALESLEPSFNQDLNGDRVIGVPSTPIQIDTNSLGTATLAASGSNYLLTSNGSTVEFTYGGAPVTVGEFGSGWNPIGAALTATGYEVAWKNGNNFIVWDTDHNGNLTSYATGELSGSSVALQSLEPSFNQDLNGDGAIGIAGTLIQADTNSFGSTSLTLVGNNYYFLSGGTGPEFTYNGAPVTVGEFGSGWNPIGAALTATGYEVAWKNGNNFIVWDTDHNGNFTSYATSELSGSSVALESLEPSFNQDLNGDNFIGVPPAVSASAAPVSTSALTLSITGFDASSIAPSLSLNLAEGSKNDGVGPQPQSAAAAPLAPVWLGEGASDSLAFKAEFGSKAMAGATGPDTAEEFLQSPANETHPAQPQASFEISTAGADVVTHVADFDNNVANIQLPNPFEHSGGSHPPIIG